MRKATLLYNPRAGDGRSRQVLVERAAEVLRAAGVEAILTATRAAGSATSQTREALANGCDVVFACGGDGTVHEVLQAMVTSGTEAALAILPLGTGNVLANDIGIPLDTAAAARWALAAEARRVPAGLIRYADATGAIGERYFTVAAGVGSHATMIYQSTAQQKSHQGVFAYYKTGLTLLLRAPFVAYEADIVDDEGTRHTGRMVDVLVMRVDSFGGLMKRWHAGGSLEHEHLHLVANCGARRRDLFRFITAIVIGHRWIPKGVEFMTASRIVCRAVGEHDARIHAQADGEFLGGLPVEISVTPSAFTLLLPRR